MLHSHTTTSLSIHVSSATQMVSMQKLGKQDPFLQFSLNFEEKDTFLRTFTHKNAGENAVWNQTFTISLNGESDLFVEVLNEENTVDEVIGFCAIPINQVVHAEGANMNGLFEIYDTKGERAGEINLQLAAIGFPNSKTPNFDCAPVRGQSYVHESHCVRMTSIKKKSTGMSIGGALLGAGLAVGAGFAGKKMYDEYQENEAEEERKKAEAEAEEQRKREEQEKFQHERDEFNSERERYEREKSEFEQKKHDSEALEKRGNSNKCEDDCRKKDCEGECKTKKKNCKPGCKKDDCEGECKTKKKSCKPNCKKGDCEGECKKKNCKSSCKKDDCEGECRRKKKDCDEGSDSDSGSSDGECRRRRKNSCSDDERDAKKWNPVGTYAAGDRVKYHDQVYVCLQGHTSNPTWQPGAAHSLWQAE